MSGGGFLTFEDSKYSGALALSVYAVAVKAFGIIETKFPDGHRGFSFIIIISAEFTPIQLGFGFTLNGVGGILGINRDLNEDALRDVVQRGSMGNVLFPKDPIKDAPSILHDIAQLFPAADGHFVFGPMAILAWGRRRSWRRGWGSSSCSRGHGSRCSGRCRCCCHPGRKAGAGEAAGRDPPGHRGGAGLPEEALRAGRAPARLERRGLPDQRATWRRGSTGARTRTW